MQVEMDRNVERQDWTRRVSKRAAVNELTPRAFAPRVCKRLKKKELVKNLCRVACKKIDIKGVVVKVEVGRGWAAMFTYDSSIRVNICQEKGSLQGTFYRRASRLSGTGLKKQILTS
jgi:hypothetical protein